MASSGGTVTLLFTDLVSSTELLDRLGDEAAEALRRAHFRLLRQAVSRRGGREVKNMGDGLMVVFPSVLDAVASAIEIQQAVYRHNKEPAETPLNIRIGLNAGEPIRDEEDYFGTAVVVAKRLCDRAEGGQILASDLVRHLAGNRGGFQFRELGRLALKGFSEPVPACEVLWSAPVEEPKGESALAAALLGIERTPFVGREAQVSALLETWGKAKAGGRHLVLIAGEPGIGKTRVAGEFAVAVAEQGGTVLFGRCDEELALPYLPFVEALRQLFARSPGAADERSARWEDLAPLIPEVQGRTTGEGAGARLDAAEERFRLYDAADRVLSEAARSAPLLVLLDDLHWADKSSLLLLRHLLRAPAAAPILFVGTYRDTDLSRTHPLAEMLGDFRRGSNFDRIHLGGLNKDGTQMLIEGWAGHEVPGQLAEAVHTATEGNPFFVQEVLRHLEEARAVSRGEGGFAALIAVEDMGIPEGVREVIGRRLSHLSEDANTVLAAGSVCGREFEAETLENVTGLSADALLNGLEEAVAAGLIVETPEAGGYRFSHALVQESLYAELSAMRRSRLHRLIGEALEARYGPKADDNATRLAHHYLEAGPLSQANITKAAHYSRLAAEQAEQQAAWHEAARHYEDCLTLASNAQEALDVDEAALLVAMGRCLRFAAQSGPAWRSFMRATTIYRERGDGVSMARAALEASASAILPPREGLVALAEEALGMLGESDLHLRARLLLMRAGDHFDDASKAAAGEAKRILGELDDPALLGELVYRQAQEAIYEQRIDEAVSLFRRAHALLDQEGERQRAGHALDWVGTWILFEGKLDEGIAVTSDALAYARKFHLRPPELWCLAVLLAAALVRCDFTKFDSLLNEAAGSSEAAEDRTFLDVVTAARAEMSGDTEQALKLAPSPGTPVGAGLLAHLLGSLARMRFNSGQEHQAGGYLEEWNRELGPILSVPIGHRLYAIAELDECLPAFGDESLVRRVYEELAAWRTLRYGPPDGRGLDHIRGALALRLERIDEAEQWFRIGLSWAKQQRCPVEEGRCLQGLAEIGSRQRRPADAVVMLDQAIALFEAHGARLFLNRATASREGLSASPPV